MALCGNLCRGRKPPTITNIELGNLSKRYRFSPQDILSFRRRFDNMSAGAGHKYVTLKQFREEMGLLGLESTSVLADRIFSAMDKSGQGKVTFGDYMDYMDVLVYGTDDEKAEQSFRLITKGNDVPITLEMFSDMMISIMKLLNVISGNRISASQEYLTSLFEQLDIEGSGAVDKQRYIAGWKSNKKIFEWLDFFNNRFAESLHPGEKRPSEEQSIYARQIQSIEEEVQMCISMLRGERMAESQDAMMRSRTIFEVSPKEVVLDMMAVPNRLNPHMYLTREMLALNGDEPPLTRNQSRMGRSEYGALREAEESFSINEPNRSAEISITRDIDGIEVREDFSYHDLDPPPLKLATSQSTDDRIKIVVDRLFSLKSSIAKLKQVGEEAHADLKRPLLNPTRLPGKLRRDTTIHWGDENWNLILNMMLGIQKAVKSANAVFDPLQSISDKEAMQKEKVNLRHAFGGASDVIGMRKLYKFRDYAPIIFEQIKRLRGITMKEYILSLGVEKIVQSLLIGNFSSLDGLMTSGKSGSFFFYSDDGKYMIKTLSKGEFMFLRSILHFYFDHVRTYPNTLITLIYGLHKILYAKNSPKMHRLYFVVMGNLFSSGIEIHERYDLKGSTYGRRTNEKEDPSVARKDLNFLAKGMKLRLDAQQREDFLRQLHNDSEFLAEHRIIDYSLLVGIHHLAPGAGEVAENPFAGIHSGIFLSADKDCLYQMGIIDTVTLYSTKKKLEHCFRSCFHPGNVVSCIPPRPYAQRFMRFMETITRVEG